MGLWKNEANFDYVDIDNDNIELGSLFLVVLLDVSCIISSHMFPRIIWYHSFT